MRRAVFVSAVVMAMVTGTAANAAVTEVPPYDNKGESTGTVDDLLGTGSSSATASADLGGALSASAESTVNAPAGTFYRLPGGYDPIFGQYKYGGQALGFGATSARGAGTVTQSFYTTGSGTFTISSQINSLTYQALASKTANLPSSILSDATAVARASMYIVFYPCDLRTQNCFAAANFLYTEKDARFAVAGSLTIAGSYTAPVGGTFQAQVGLFSETTAKGQASARSQVAGTVSSISIAP